MSEHFSRFDTTEYLKTPEDMTAYLDACLTDDSGNGLLIQAALNDIARAYRRNQIARNSAVLGRRKISCTGSSLHTEKVLIAEKKPKKCAETDEAGNGSHQKP